MPIYEYRCSQCGKTFEQLRSLRDSDEDVRCPKCEAGRVERQLSGFSAGGGCSSKPGGSRFS